MTGYEEECGTVCTRLFDMSEGEGRVLETWWNSTAFGHIRVEME